MSPRALKACGGCGTPTTTTPCPECTPPKPSGTHTRTRTARGYDNDWLRLSERARRKQPWCAWPAGCTYPITKRNPLTSDHNIPLSRAPHLRLDPTNIVVLCRRHNSIKGDQTLAEVSGRR